MKGVLVLRLIATELASYSYVAIKQLAKCIGNLLHPTSSYISQIYLRKKTQAHYHVTHHRQRWYGKEKPVSKDMPKQGQHPTPSLFGRMALLRNTRIIQSKYNQTLGVKTCKSHTQLRTYLHTLRTLHARHLRCVGRPVMGQSTVRCRHLWRHVLYKFYHTQLQLADLKHLLRATKQA